MYGVTGIIVRATTWPGAQAGAGPAEAALPELGHRSAPTRARPLPLAVVVRAPALPRGTAPETALRVLESPPPSARPPGAQEPQTVAELLRRNPAFVEAAVQAVLSLTARDLPPRDAVEQVVTPVAERLVTGEPLFRPPATPVDDLSASQRLARLVRPHTRPAAGPQR